MRSSRRSTVTSSTSVVSSPGPGLTASTVSGSVSVPGLLVSALARRITARLSTANSDDRDDRDAPRVLGSLAARGRGVVPPLDRSGRVPRTRDAGAGTLAAMAISGVADLTGRVLAGRYRVLAPIGAGASGRVYVADDVRLRRRVAVKVLHAGLADDARLPPPLPGRGPGRGVAAPPEHHGGLRLGRRRRPVHGARAARRAAACAALLDAGARCTPVAGGARRASGRPPRSSTRTRAASSTATSSPRTCSSTSTASCASPTSASRARSRRRAGPSPRARSSAPRGTRRPSRRPARRSTAAPTSTRSRSCSSEAVTGTVPGRRRDRDRHARGAHAHRARRAARARSARAGRRARRASRSRRALSRRRHDGRRARRRGAGAAAAARRWRSPASAARSTSSDPTRIGRVVRACSTRTRREPRRRRDRPDRAATSATAAHRAVSVGVLVALARRRSRWWRAVSRSRATGGGHGRGAVARRAHVGARPTKALDGAGLDAADRHARRRRPRRHVIAQDPGAGLVRGRAAATVELVVSRGPPQGRRSPTSRASRSRTRPPRSRSRASPSSCSAAPTRTCRSTA